MAVLDSIIAGVREDLAERQTRVSLEDLKERARKMPSALSAEDALAATANAACRSSPR